jgi:YYY domain-containing protein
MMHLSAETPPTQEQTPSQKLPQDLRTDKTDVTNRSHYSWVWDVILMGILILGAYFRFTGVNWDQGTHMHPDERFLTWVVSSMQPVKSIGDYFNTATSTLNPHNVGFGFYVYGTLPVILVRYVAEWVKEAGYGEVQIIGRQISALFDLGTALCVYLIAGRLFRKPRLAPLAAAFYALAVLPIQLSHYFKDDTFVTFFSALAFYFGVRILPGQDADDPARPAQLWGGFGNYGLFGAAFGMALACKINIAPLAVVLPGAALIWFLAQPAETRERHFWPIVLKLAAAGLVALVAFRIFQPYAFSGPGFLGLIPNERWVQNMRDIAAQNAGDIDFPPQLQWARRPLWFSWWNQVVYGFGSPLGLAAWAGFLAMGWRILRGSGEERRHYILIWLWCGAYFIWQSISPTRTMRYQMPTYPLLAVIASWGIFSLHAWGKSRFSWQRILAGVGGIAVLAATLGWAYAFIGIYIRPFTRVDASRWIYQNIPSAVNVRVESSNGDEVNHPLSFNHGFVLQPGQPLRIGFTPWQDGRLLDLRFDHIVDVSSETTVRDGGKSFVVTIVEAGSDETLAYGLLTNTFPPEGEGGRGNSFTVILETPLGVESGKRYQAIFNLVEEQARLKLSGPVLLSLDTGESLLSQPLPEPEEALLENGAMIVNFSADVDGTVRRVYLNRVVDWEATPELKRVRVSLGRMNAAPEEISSGEIVGDFLPGDDKPGEGLWFNLEPPVQVRKGEQYALEFKFVRGPGRLAVYGSKIVQETTWDDALPLGLDGNDPNGYNTGLFRTELNFEMYWDDNPDKLERFLTNLEQADTLFISSNRQWGTTTRVPERYPLTTLYYRSLVGCPEEKDILWCYSVAEPGMFNGKLGFDLVHVVQSDPVIGPLRINTQFAEEAFTVYDHPKVLIFRKNESYDRDAVRALFKTVDLSKVVHLTPGKAGSYVGNLMLPAARLALQRAGGTWAELFNREAWVNRFPGLGVIVWYLVLSLLGWLVYPIVRLALHGLPDRGYPLARTAAMVLLAYPVWLLSSAGLPFERPLITIVVVVLAAVGLGLGWLQRKDLAVEWREKKNYFLAVEAITLTFFVLFLLVRLGNGDLWHPWKGGEKPMDFSYFNAVLKSSVFPPYDPWLAGGYINYYYYGFVLVGVPVKWLGIVPSIAYNFILPTLFSMLALGGFSAVWNILSGYSRGERDNAERPWVGGLTGAAFLVLMGNLGSLRMLWHAIMKLSAPNGDWAVGNILQRIVWTVGGIVQFVSQPRPLYAPGEWYWIPSRALPASSGDPITEFPAFTFLYADLHAHMIALPLTILALSWALAIVMGKWRWGEANGKYARLHFAVSMVLGALVIGALRPTNTWDFPTYLALAGCAILYAVFSNPVHLLFHLNLPDWRKRTLSALVSLGLLAGLAILFYQPFSRWYGQGYNAVGLWENGHSPTWSYLTHWGLFLFAITTYLIIESLDWMAKTPLSALNKLRPYLGWMAALVTLVAVGMLVLLLRLVWVTWLVVPLMTWAAVLLLRPGMLPARRALLFIVGTGLALTLLVEVVVLVGDINRMNTVFKFYLQAWVLLGVAAAAALGWAVRELDRVFSPGWRGAWHVFTTLLIGAAALFPLLAGADKINDRMSPNAPHTLDGMTYMASSTYHESDSTLDLREDYDAIRWMQDNVSGSPVIVEGHVGEYRWGNRYTIYTGLPSVVGWNWHQRQQRAVTPETWVTSRVAAVDEFYTQPDPQKALDFLRRYEVSYIIVGQMERAIYPVEGLAKFEQENGRLWEEVYRAGQTVIYKVR